MWLEVCLAQWYAATVLSYRFFWDVLGPPAEPTVSVGLETSGKEASPHRSTRHRSKALRGQSMCMTWIWIFPVWRSHQLVPDTHNDHRRDDQWGHMATRNRHTLTTEETKTTFMRDNMANSNRLNEQPTQLYFLLHHIRIYKMTGLTHLTVPSFIINYLKWFLISVTYSLSVCDPGLWLDLVQFLFINSIELLSLLSDTPLNPGSRPNSKLFSLLFDLFSTNVSAFRQNKLLVVIRVFCYENTWRSLWVCEVV